MPIFGSDEILWYRVGVWGELGFAAPNFGNDLTTLNTSIRHLVQICGRNIQNIMLHSDADSTTPPSINTLRRVHRLVVRIRQILAAREVMHNETRFEPTHATPSPAPFMIFPTPYWKVRNNHMREWCELALLGLSEAMQHTDNRIELEVTVDFTCRIGQYFHRIYYRMATELFGVPKEEAKALGFTMSDQVLESYDPSKWFTSTEMIDTVPDFRRIPTEDDLKVMTDGIPTTQIAGLVRWPNGEPPPGTIQGVGQQQTQTTTGAAAFSPPPGP